MVAIARRTLFILSTRYGKIGLIRPGRPRSVLKCGSRLSGRCRLVKDQAAFARSSPHALTRQRKKALGISGDGDKACAMTQPASSVAPHHPLVKTALLFALAACLLMLSGCATFAKKPFGSIPGAETPGAVSVVDATEMPAPLGITDTQGNVIYRVNAGDKVVVDVFGMPEMSNREYIVDEAGNMSILSAGRITARGLTPRELEQQIEAGLRRNYLRNPQVSVNVVSAQSRLVTVDGEVKRPGSYPVIANQSLMRTVAQAEGTSEYASLKDVVVFRTVGDQKMAALYNLEGIRRGNYADPKIYAGDIVVVGDSASRRILRDAGSIAQILSTPLILLLQ